MARKKIEIKPIENWSHTRGIWSNASSSPPRSSISLEVPHHTSWAGGQAMPRRRAPRLLLQAITNTKSWCEELHGTLVGTWKIHKRLHWSIVVDLQVVLPLGDLPCVPPSGLCCISHPHLLTCWGYEKVLLPQVLGLPRSRVGGGFGFVVGFAWVWFLKFLWLGSMAKAQAHPLTVRDVYTSIGGDQRLVGSRSRMT